MDARIIAGIVALLVLVGGCASEKMMPAKSAPVSQPETAAEESPVVAPDAVVQSSSDITSVVLHTKDEDIVIEVELAETDEERATGLSGRTVFGDKGGMLFVFPESAPVSFHMFGVPFLVDVLFIGEDMVVKNMATMSPCSREPCPQWHAREPVKYALEVPGGFIKNHPMGRDVTVSFQ